MDSTDTGIKINEYKFKGPYANCVSLIDSLSKTQEVGRITRFRIASATADDHTPAGTVLLELEMAALAR
ncbi:hypothetical protein D9M68_477080 [compost metagenome]